MPPLLKSRRFWLIAGPCLAFAVLWIPTAYARGMLMAHFDNARGEYRVLTYGTPRTPRLAAKHAEYSGLLRERYGVKLNPVDGPMGLRVTWYVTGYNSVSKRLLQQQYGLDVFQECRELADRKMFADE